MVRLIEDYAFLSDLETAALVHRRASIDWCCFPRFDSDACLAALLGKDEHGRWRVAPVVDGAPTRRDDHRFSAGFDQPADGVGDSLRERYRVDAEFSARSRVVEAGGAAPDLDALAVGGIVPPLRQAP
jgi:hypothetical protein